MNCAWCNPSQNGTDGICDACMLLYFKIDPVVVHQDEFDAVPSYVEINAAAMVLECNQILAQVEVAYA